jgi:hypothetical protein
MSMRSTLFAIVTTALVMFGPLALAQDTATSNVSLEQQTTRAAAAPWRFDVSTSPQFFYPFLGYEVAASVRAPAVPWMRFTAYSFSLQLPDMFLGENSGRGWTVRHVAPLVPGVEFFPFYHWQHRGGFFAGLSVAPHVNFYSRQGATASVFELYLLPQIGYQWLPFPHNGFFLQIWVGPGIEIYRSGPIVAAGTEFKPGILSPIGSLDVGWEF